MFKPSRLLLAVPVWILLIVELYFLAYYKNDIQASSCGHAEALQSLVPLPQNIIAHIVSFHKFFNSFAWMLLAAFFAFFWTYSNSPRNAPLPLTSAEFYSFMVLGHVLKNFAKSFIQSPRGFWFCTEGSSVYCGKGFSLPSGHSMMSLSFSLYLLHQYPRSPGLFIMVLILLSWIVFEVVYLGTHTAADVVVGFTFGAAWFCLYHVVIPLLEPSEKIIALSNGTSSDPPEGKTPQSPTFARPAAIVKESNEKSSSSANTYIDTDFIKGGSGVVNAQLWLLLLLALTVVVYRGEKAEAMWDSAVEHPIDHKLNYERYCALKPGTATDAMRNSSAYEKTALVIGLAIGWFLRARFGLGLPRSGNRWLVSILGVVVVYFAGWAGHQVAATFFAGNAEASRWIEYIALGFQPAWVLALGPLLLTRAQEISKAKLS